MRWLLFAVLLVSTGVLPAEDLPVVAWQGRTMGTVYTVKVVGGNLGERELAALKSEVEARLGEISLQMSTYRPDSEISRFNRASAGCDVRVSPELASVVRYSLGLCRRSEGAFDPTLGPVINLWGFGEQDARRNVPSEEALKAAMEKTGWKHLSVTEGGGIRKAVSGLTLNLGGVAKGFGVDQIAGILRAHKLENFYVAIAGDVLVSGHSPRGGKWRLGIASPVDHWREAQPMARVILLRNRALSTSGDYQNFFRDADGRRRAHIIDPKSGHPVQHSLAAVSVIAPDSMTADALGTALFVLGVEEGLEFIDADEDAAALFLIRETDGSFRQVASRGFLEWTGP